MSTSQISPKHSPSRPTRLQSSPSLPNLRTRNVSLPPQITRPQPSPLNSASRLDFLSSPDSSPKITLKDVDLHPSHKPTKNQHYLTPPLTPASSLKSDSTDPDPTDLNTAHEAHQSASGDGRHSRFLIIGDVPRNLSEDVITRHFHALASATEDNGSLPLEGAAATNTSIQSLDFRLRDKCAVVIAFYDVRDAEKVKRLIQAKHFRSQPEIIGKGKQRAHSETVLRISWEQQLTCLLVNPAHLLKILGEPALAIMTRSEGVFCVLVTDAFCSSPPVGRSRGLSHLKLRNVLSKYGDIKLFRILKGNGDKHGQLFMIGYFDVRAAEASWELDGHVIENMQLRFIPRDGLLNEHGATRDSRREETSSGPEGHFGGGNHAAEPKTPTTANYLSRSQAGPVTSGLPFPTLNDISSASHRCSREGPSVEASDSPLALNKYSLPLSDLPPHSLPQSVDTHGSATDSLLPISPPYHRGGTVIADQPGRRGSNNTLFDAVRPRASYKRIDANHSRLPNMCSGARESTQTGPLVVEEVPGGNTNLYCTPYPSAQSQAAHDYFSRVEPLVPDVCTQPSWLSSSSHTAATPMQYPQSSVPSMYWDSLTGSWVSWNPMAEHWPAYPPPSMFFSGPTPPAMHYPYPQQPSSPIPVSSYQLSMSPTFTPTYPTSPRSPPENNQLDIARIAQGLDTRTTVMIKNIPNKMTDKELIEFINNVCPRRIDFLYLRMDFQNGCNVGYAFVNFISVEDLLKFAQRKLNEKWNMYSSEKVLQMSYANYQGKEALVEKFKNSCIMDEREEWRPKIFYSDGPRQGLPEEFPKPTHMRRKERSSFNRGALFVPGIPAHQRTFATTNAHQRIPSHRQQGQGEERRVPQVLHGTRVHGNDGGSRGENPRT